MHIEGTAAIVTGGGAIVNMLSAAALTNIPNMGGYGPSKAAARFLSAGVRAELADQGTRVTMDPKGYERGLAKLLKADRLSTGK